MSRLRKIIVAGLLLATTIVLSRFLSIRTPITTMGFSFVSATLAGMLLGPWWSMFVSGLADLIGALLFPTGAFFPGYTLTALITGFIYGFVLGNSHKKTVKQVLIRAIIAHIAVVVLCSVGLNTLWTWYLTKKALVVILPTRLINAAVMLPVRVIFTVAIHLGFQKGKIYEKLYKSSLEDDDENSDESELSAPNESETSEDSSATLEGKTANSDENSANSAQNDLKNNKNITDLGGGQ